MARSGRLRKAPKAGLLENKSYRNIFYGILTVFVIFLVALAGINLMRTTGTIEEEGITTTADEETNIYVIQEGDTLWAISEKFYKDGHQWPKIAGANRIQNPNLIEKGAKIVIPDIPLTVTPTKTVKEPTGESLSSPGSKITGTIYTVIRGDNLWNIAVRAYGDGFKWVEIAKANKLINPHVIHRGNVFKIPR